MIRNLSNMALMIMVFVASIGLLPSTSLASTSSGVVNINAASAKQLQYLKGIGAKKAKAIVEFRTNAPFKTVDELAKVKGIGKKLVDSLRPQLSIKGETSLRPPKTNKRRHTKKKS